MVEVVQHFAGLVGVEVSHDDRLDLRVLVADHVRHRPRLHPLEAVQAAGIATQQDAVDQAVGLVFAQGLGEHLAHVVIGADAQAGLVADDLDELAHDLFDLLTVHVAHLRHRHADPLDFLGPHVAQHLCSISGAQRQQQDPAALSTRVSFWLTAALLLIGVNPLFDDLCHTARIFGYQTLDGVQLCVITFARARQQDALRAAPG